MKADLTPLTERQRVAWQMRYQYGWRLRKIAIRMGIKTNSVSELLQRATKAAGLPPRTYVPIIRTKPRRVYAVSLSDMENYQAIFRDLEAVDEQT